ncbi:MAG TPA: site-2 protease family protein [Acidimicrobiales bacterium]|nr:site-2 protease family protein [Acidimicrobiales bacterium]
MRDTVRLGRIAGVGVGLNWSLIAMVAIVGVELARNRFPFDAPGYSGGAYTLAGFATAAVLLFGVLLHELGHAVLARRFGLKVDGITLSWMGGVTRIHGEAVRPGEEFAVAGVGPLVSAAFGGLLLILRLAAEGMGAGKLLVAALGWLAGINVFLAIFNLLPAAPLDGGRVLHSTVWAIGNDRWRATRAAGITGIGLGAVMIVVGFAMITGRLNSIDGILVAAIGWWILGSARVELALGAVHHALDGVRMSDLMRPVGSAPGWITVRAFADGYAAGRPGWVWLLEGWQGGYSGAIPGDSLAAVPLPQWDLARPVDLALPISQTMGAGPTEEALAVMQRRDGKEVIFVVDGGRTVGAVLASDVDALVRMGGSKSPSPWRRAVAGGWQNPHVGG